MGRSIRIPNIMGNFKNGYVCFRNLIHKLLINTNPTPTVLLITSPAIKLWKKDVQIALAPNSLVNIDPILRDAEWLRNYARKLLIKPNICQPFPSADFDWEVCLYGQKRIKFTFADIDKYSRNLKSYTDLLPSGQCVGWMNIIVVEMNVSTM